MGKTSDHCFWPPFGCPSRNLPSVCAKKLSFSSYKVCCVCLSATVGFLIWWLIDKTNLGGASTCHLISSILFLQQWGVTRTISSIASKLPSITLELTIQGTYLAKYGAYSQIVCFRWTWRQHGWTSQVTQLGWKPTRKRKGVYDPNKELVLSKVPSWFNWTHV